MLPDLRERCNKDTIIESDERRKKWREVGINRKTKIFYGP